MSMIHTKSNLEVDLGGARDEASKSFTALNKFLTFVAEVLRDAEEDLYKLELRKGVITR